MHFHHGKQPKAALSIQIDNLDVEEKNTVKYLGTLIDNKLTWKPHIQHIKTKLSRAIGVLSKIRYFSTKNVLLNMYYSFVQSHISYNLLNWSCANTTAINPLRNCIKKVVRIIQFKNKYEHTLPIFKELNILPLDAQIKHKQAMFMWKLSNNLIPLPVSNLFNQINNNQNNKYKLPNPKSEFGKRLVNYSCVKVWNSEVPLQLKTLTGQNNFNLKYKEHLLNLLN